VIVGTAGHIDHGKSALVELLTGVRMDRLAEERARGITIDLNFAPLTLPGGEIAGIVDVPGHEDFVRTMVAGAAGIDLVLLVVAADEGIMPQTREHLAIVEALGVPRGVAVVTKADLVEEDWLALVRDDVDKWLAASPVAFGAAIPTSSRSGTGLEEVRQALASALDAAGPRDPSAPFRMPIDRAFSVAGAGTVVTGSVWSGSVSLGDHLRLLPGDRPVRVRSLEVHGHPRQRASAGSRVALGLANVDREQVRRGDIAVDASLPWEPSTALDVRIGVVDDAPRPLTSRTRVHLHLGTSGVVARVLPRGPIAPGGTGLARLSCEAPIIAAGGDRFVLRSYSPVHTLGGGVVLDPLPPRRRSVWPPGLGAAEESTRLLALLARRRPGVDSLQLALLSGLPSRRVEAVLAAETAVRNIGGLWVEAAQVEEARRRALELVAAHHAASPAALGVPIETLRRAIHHSPVVAEAAVADLAASGQIVQDAGSARLPGFQPSVEGGEAGVGSVVEAVRVGGLEAPRLGDLERRFPGVDVPGALRMAAGDGRVVALTGEWYLSREALAGFVDTLRSAAQSGEVVLGVVRERTGLSRKYLIPLLEWADREGITRRVGEGRRLT
jgi:selenocysteine-specific elongation factor